MPVRGQPVAQATARLEQRLVDGAPGGAELQRQHVDRHPAQQDRLEDHPLLLAEVFRDPPAQRFEHPVLSRRGTSRQAEADRELGGPLSPARRQRTGPPLLLGDLRGDLRHHELGHPDGERGLAALAQIGDDRGQRARRGLLGQRAWPRAVRRQLIPPAVCLGAGGLQQQVLQPGRRFPRLLPGPGQPVRPGLTRRRLSGPCACVHRASLLGPGRKSQVMRTMIAQSPEKRPPSSAVLPTAQVGTSGPVGQATGCGGQPRAGTAASWASVAPQARARPSSPSRSGPSPPVTMKPSGLAASW